MARHPVLLLIALTVVMSVGALSVSSTVEIALVGTSWLGLHSSAGLWVSAACSVLSLAAMLLLLLLLILSAGGGEDDDDRGDDDEPPAPEGPSGEPAWWPDFERDLDAYLREPERSRSSALH